MTAKLAILVTAQNQASKVLNDIGGDAQKMEGKVSRLGGALKVGLFAGATAAVAGVAALGAVMASSVKAASEMEDIQAQLNATLKSTKGVAGISAEAINAHADALEKTTKFTAEQTVSASSLLLTFTKVGKDVFPKATEAILDMSQAMGMDLQGATIMVGKALNDPIAGITAMSRAGIQFSQEQKDTIKTMVEMGDTAGAQAMILKELETQFGGSAVAAGKTFSGQMEILKNGIGAVTDEIGVALLPVLTYLVRSVGPVLTSLLEKVVGLITTYVVPAIEIFANVLGGLSDDGWNLADVVGYLSYKFPALAGAFETVGAVVGTLIDWFRSLVDTFKGAGEGINPVREVLQRVWDTLVGIGEAIMAQVMPTIQALSAIWTDTLLPAFQTVVDAVMGALLPALMSLWSYLGTILPPVIEAVGRFFREHILPALAAVASFIIGTVIPVIIQLVAWMVERIPVAIEAVAGFFRNVLIPALSAIWSFIQDNVIPILTTLVTWLADNIPPAIQTLADFWNNTLKPALEAVWSFIQDSVIPIFVVVAEWLQAKIPEAVQKASDFWNNILQPALEAVWEFIQENILPIFVKVFEWLKDKLPTAVQETANFWNTKLKPALEAVWKFIRDYVIPIFEGLVKLGIKVLEVAVLALILVWNTKLKPALKTVWEFIRDNVIPIFVEIKDKLDGPVTTALNALKTLLEGPVKTGLGIFEGALNAIKGALEGIGGAIDTVLGWLDRLADKIRNLPSPPAIFTPSSPTPFETGLRGIADALAVTTRNLGPFGGAISGLTGIASTTVDVFGQLASILGTVKTETAEQAAKIASAIGTVLSTLVAAIEAVNTLATATLPQASIGGTVDRLIVMLSEIVVKFAEAAKQFKVEGLEAASQFASAASAIAGSIKTAIDGITAAAAFVAPTTNNMEALFAWMAQMVSYLQTIANRIDQTYMADAFAAARLLAETAGKIGGQLKAAVDGITAAANFVAPKMDNMEALFEWMARFVAYLQTVANRIDATYMADAFAAARLLAETAGKIGGQLKAAIEGINAAAGFVPPAMDNMEALFGWMSRFVAYMQTVANRIDQTYMADGFAAARLLAETAGKIGGQMKAAVEGILLAFNFTLPDTADGTDRLFEALRSFVARLQTVAIFMDYQAFDAALKLAEAAGKIGTGVKAAIEGILLAMSFGGGKPGFSTASSYDGTDRLFEALRKFVAKLQTVAIFMDYQAFDAALRLAEAAGKIGAGVKAAVEGIMLAMSFGAGKPTISTAYTYDGTDLLFEALRKFVARLQTVAIFMDYQAFDAALKLADAAGKIGAGVKAAIEGIQLAISYGGGKPGISSASSYDGTDRLFEALRKFVTKLQAVALYMDYEAFDAAIKLAEAAGKIGSNIKNAIEGIQLALSYGMSDKTDNLGRDGMSLLIRHMQAFVKKLVEAGLLFDKDGLAAAVAFAEAAGKIGSSIKNAIDGMVLVAKYAGVDLVDGVRLFAEDIRIMIAKLSEVASTLEVGATGAAVAFAEAAGKIGGNIAAAVEGLGLIFDYTGGIMDVSFDRFINDMRRMVDKLSQVGTLFDADALAAATTFAAAAGAVGGEIAKAIEGLKGIIGYTGGLTVALMDQFADDVELMVQKLNEVAFTLGSDAVEAARVFGVAAGAIGSGVKSMLDGLAGLKDYSGPAVTSVDAFIADLQNVVDKMRLAAERFDAGGLASAQAFAQTGAAILDALLAGVQSVVTLNQTGGLGGLGAAMQYILTEVTNTVRDVAIQFANMVTAAYGFGRNWTQAIIDGLTSRLGDLEELMAYIRGLFPSSPAKFGPFANMPQGAAVGRQFAAELSKGIRSGVGGVTSSLSQVRSAMVSGGAGGAVMATAPVRARGNVNITITGNQFSSQDDVDYLLDQLDRRLRLRGGLLPL